MPDQSVNITPEAIAVTRSNFVRSWVLRASVARIVSSVRWKYQPGIPR